MTTTQLTDEEAEALVEKFANQHGLQVKYEPNADRATNWILVHLGVALLLIGTFIWLGYATPARYVPWGILWCTYGTSLLSFIVWAGCRRAQWESLTGIALLGPLYAAAALFLAMAHDADYTACSRHQGGDLNAASIHQTRNDIKELGATGFLVVEHGKVFPGVGYRPSAPPFAEPSQWALHHSLRLLDV